MLTLEYIDKVFKTKNRKKVALDEISLKLPSKGLITILGPSGSGKTTLLNILSGNLLPDSGQISYDGEIIRKSNRDSLSKSTSYIYQEYNLIEGLNVLDNLKIALKTKGIDLNDDEIFKITSSLGLKELLASYPDELSGGEQQRVAIARAILSNDKILLADEVTGALDHDNAKIVMDILKYQSKERLVVLVTHDRDIAKEYSDRIIEMKKGSIVSDITNNELDYNVSHDKLELSKEKFSSYYMRLGFKYINFKSFKMYLSFIIMVLTFAVMLVSFSFLWFNKEDAYNSINDSKYDYTYISKYEADSNLRRNLIFTEADLAKIAKVEASTYKMYSPASKLNHNDKVVDIAYYMEASNELFNEFNLKLVGRMPQIGEVLLTSKLLSEINEDDYRKVTYSGRKVSGYIICPIEYEALFDLNDIAFLGSVDIENYAVYGLYSKKLSADKMKTINNMVTDNTFIKASNASYDSLLRADIFSDSMIKISIPVTLFLLIISFLVLVNTVYIAIDNNKNDIRIIRMLGGRMKSLFSIFSIQPIAMVLTSLLLSFVIYGVASVYINSYIIEEFNMAIALISLTGAKIALIVGLLIIFTIVSILIPISYKKRK